MFLEIMLVLILIFLIIIAIQNSARGGMQADKLSTIIYFLNSTEGATSYLAKVQHVLNKNNDELNRDDSYDNPSIVKKEPTKK